MLSGNGASLSASNLVTGSLEFTDLGYCAQLCVASGGINSGLHAFPIGVSPTGDLQAPELDFFSCWDNRPLWKTSEFRGEVGNLPSTPWLG